jgi:hypothetical protein
MKHGLSIPTNRLKGLLKKALIERIEVLLSEQECNKEEKKVSEAVDYSMFDFGDSDSDGSLEIVCPDAPATVEEDVPEILKIEEFRQHIVTQSRLLETAGDCHQGCQRQLN